MKKSCLKHKQQQLDRAASLPSIPSPSAPKNPSTPRPLCTRTVSFADKSDDEIHPADDWDRTPVDIAQRLSYEYVRPLESSFH